jgi:hypothetical protein
MIQNCYLKAGVARGVMRPPVGEFAPVSEGLDVQLQTP